MAGMAKKKKKRAPATLRGSKDIMKRAGEIGGIRVVKKAKKKK